MPFRSKAQMRYLYSQHPKIAKEFASKTKNFKNLPEKVAFVFEGFSNELEKLAFINIPKAIGAAKTLGKSLWGAGKAAIKGNEGMYNRFIGTAKSSASRLPGAQTAKSIGGFIQRNPLKTAAGVGAAGYMYGNTGNRQ